MGIAETRRGTCDDGVVTAIGNGGVKNTPCDWGALISAFVCRGRYISG